MPLNYLDSSALIKRYLPERGSDWVARLCRQEPIAISLITVPEIACAFGRRAREGALTAEQRDTLFQAFGRDMQSFVVIEPAQAIVRQATTLLLTAAVPLRTLDALHLATAVWTFARLRRRGFAVGAFVTADRALLGAASWAGLTSINPEEQR